MCVRACVRACVRVCVCACVCVWVVVGGGGWGGQSWLHSVPAIPPAARSPVLRQAVPPPPAALRRLVHVIRGQAAAWQEWGGRQPGHVRGKQLRWVASTPRSCSAAARPATTLRAPTCAAHCPPRTAAVHAAGCLLHTHQGSHTRRRRGRRSTARTGRLRRQTAAARRRRRGSS